MDLIPKNLNATLSDEDKNCIRELFLEEVVPKLKRLHARIGNISCAFAGSQYEKWVIQFRSRGSDFEIVGFEYDEQACAMDLEM
jgi:hypothetical protein